MEINHCAILPCLQQEPTKPESSLKGKGEISTLQCLQSKEGEEQFPVLKHSVFWREKRKELGCEFAMPRVPCTSASNILIHCKV